MQSATVVATLKFKAGPRIDTFFASFFFQFYLVGQISILVTSFNLVIPFLETNWFSIMLDAIYILKLDNAIIKVYF